MHKIKKFNLQIDCPIFSEYEERIKKLTQSINGRKVISKKAHKAQELLNIINILLFCPKYDERRENCVNCHFILNLRKEIARIIVEATGTTRFETTY